MTTFNNPEEDNTALIVTLIFSGIIWLVYLLTY